MKFGWAALCLAALSAGAFAQDSAPPSRAAAKPRATADFAALATFERPILSPDGEHIAGKLALEGKQYFAVLSASGGKPALVSSKIDINWYRWVNKDWLVVGVGDKQGTAYGPMYVRRVVGVSTAGKTVPILADKAAQDGSDVIWTAKDGSPRILVGVQQSVFSDDMAFWPTVFEVDVSTGKSRAVAGPRSGIMTWAADATGKVRMGIGGSTDGRSRRVLYRDAAATAFKEIVHDAKADEALDIPSAFLAEPGKAIAIAENDRGEDAVFEYDLVTLQRGKQLYASPGFDIDGVRLGTDGASIAGVNYDEDAPRTEWVDPRIVAIEKKLAGNVSNAKVRVTSYSDDYRRVLFYVGSPSSPGAYYLFDATDSAIDPVSQANPAIKMARLHAVRTVRYKARDGLEIAAVLTLPEGNGRALPLIVLPHGGPFARDDESWDWWAQFLADRGYAVIQPNYRGSSGYGSAFAQKGEGQWGLAMQDDLDDAVDYLAKEGIADPKRVCMVGASYGGYAALRAAQRDGARYRCAISYAGVSDLDAMRKYDGKFLYAGARSDWLKRQAPDFRSVSPLYHAAEFAAPVLIVHGKEDDVVPIAQSRDMVAKLKSAGKPVTYIEQPLADHHFTRGEDRLEFLTAMEAFLKENNPAG